VFVAQWGRDDTTATATATAADGIGVIGVIGVADM